jgi:medium-chain acyl-[acyl-carrier-protein] hydrolase
MFTHWKRYLNANSAIELVPVELAGRGKRIYDPLYHNLQDAVEDLYHRNSGEIANAPYAFFGHSLGGLLAYELALKIKQINTRQPIHLFFSGRSAPNVDNPNERKYHLMEDEEFKEEVVKLGGTPRDFFEYVELTDLFMPLLRNDFKLAETDLIQRKVNPFDCDITIFSGKEDHRISGEQIDGWKAHTNGRCTFHYFNGGHFFIHDEVTRIVKLIDNTLKEQC